MIKRFILVHNTAPDNLIMIAVLYCVFLLTLITLQCLDIITDNLTQNRGCMPFERTEVSIANESFKI